MAEVSFITTPTNPHTGPRQTKKRDGTKVVARKHFEKLYAEWLTVRAGMAVGFGSDHKMDQASDREHELARLIAATPAPCSFMLFWKIEVLHEFLEASSYTQHPEFVLLAGIEADLRRFKIDNREDGDDV